MWNGLLAWVTDHLGYPGVSEGKESACNARDLGLISGLGRSPGEGNGNRLRYLVFLPREFHRGAWRVTALGVVKSQT